MSDCVPQRGIYVIKDWRQHGYLRGQSTYPLFCANERGAWVWDGTDATFADMRDVYYAVKRYDTNMHLADAPRVLLCYLHRTVCVGMQLKAAFRQIGCDTRSAGPQSPHAWGRQCHESDYEPPDYELSDELWDIEKVRHLVSAMGWCPDVIIMVDQQDDFRLIGAIENARTKFIYIAVENWDQTQHALTARRRADLEFYCVNHWQSVKVEGERITVQNMPGSSPPLAPHAQWLSFGVDPCTRPFLDMPRDKLVCQIGIAYEPRYRIWNHLREVLDHQPPLGAEEWNKLPSFIETARTIFGFALRHRDAALVYNRSLTTLSSSNVDYAPERIPHAFATGCIMLSDDVPMMRTAWGGPWPENPDAIWVSYDRTAEGILKRLNELFAQPKVLEHIRARAFYTVMSGHTWAHRARAMLRGLGIEPIGKLM